MLSLLAHPSAPIALVLPFQYNRHSHCSCMGCSVGRESVGKKWTRYLPPQESLFLEMFSYDYNLRSPFVLLWITCKGPAILAGEYPFDSSMLALCHLKLILEKVVNWWQSKAEDTWEGIKLFKMTGSTPQFLYSSMANKVRLCSGQKNTVEHLFNFCQRKKKKATKNSWENLC